MAVKRIIAKIRRALDRRRAGRDFPVLTDWELMVLSGGHRYRAARPYIYGIVGRRED